MDQATWNLLFGWMGRRCFIPEGCPVPLYGVAFYLAVIFLAYLVYRYREELVLWIKS
ncbi:MAG: hypothetical protein ABEJ64_00720 [Candidatus Nanohaloarchaea archaeon]